MQKQLTGLLEGLFLGSLAKLRSSSGANAATEPRPWWDASRGLCSSTRGLILVVGQRQHLHVDIHVRVQFGLAAYVRVGSTLDRWHALWLGSQCGDGACKVRVHLGLFARAACTPWQPEGPGQAQIIPIGAARAPIDSAGIAGGAALVVRCEGATVSFTFPGQQISECDKIVAGTVFVTGASLQA